MLENNSVAMTLILTVLSPASLAQSVGGQHGQYLLDL